MNSTSENILQVRNLSKSFGTVKALDQVELNVKPGEVHAVMGENGAGKSTLMKMLIGMLTPDSGEIIFEGKPVKHTNVHIENRFFLKYLQGSYVMLFYSTLKISF